MYRWYLNLFGWKSFVAEQPDTMRPMAQHFQMTFNQSQWMPFLLCLLITLLIAWVYYYPFNNGKGSFGRHFHFRMKWWVLAMIISSLLVGFGTYGFLNLYLGKDGAFSPNVQMYFIHTSILNILYALLLFVIISLFLTKCFKGKLLSNASCTPFGK